MHTHAIVNYHVSVPHRQAYQIDADGVDGKITSPELVATSIKVEDLRQTHRSPVFARDGLVFVEAPYDGAICAESSEWHEPYDAHLKRLATTHLDAREAIVFDHTIRVDDPQSSRKPARNVHCDYSPQGARERLRDLLGEELAAEWSEGHFAFVNAWRPISPVIRTAPLGFIRPSSVAQEDWVTIDLIYPQRTGQIMGLVANDNHQWVYRSHMTRDDVALFNIFDNRGLSSVPHSALDLIENEAPTATRASLESRLLVRY